MAGKKILFMLLPIIILFSFNVSAGWIVDFDEDGCVDDADLKSASEHLEAIGTSKYDVNNDRIVNSKDLVIIQAYIDRGPSSNSCDGFECVTEECNSEDDDCDGEVDENTDEEMCGSTQTCIGGRCVLMAGSCVDTDGYDIFEKGNSIGETFNNKKINQNEACYEIDIYKKQKEVQECYGNNCFLHEYECLESGVLEETKVNCEYGCRYGKCRNIINRCLEEDDGIDIFKLSDGSFEEKTGEITPLIDYCKDTNADGIYDTLVEYECISEYDPVNKILNEEYIEYEITCSCDKGICTKVKNGTCIDTDGNDQYTIGFTKSTENKDETVADFDYCMLKTNDGYEEIDKCTGDKCYLTEYFCLSQKALNKFIHECPLGCINGFCIGTECSKDETFVLNEGQVLTYDDKCEILIKEPQNKFDLPGDNFNVLKDFACCSGLSEAYCVYNGQCYSSSRTSNYYELNNEIVACGCTDSTCTFSDGNHVGLWYDLDSSKGMCEGITDDCNVKWYSETKFKWIKPGLEKNQKDSVWEYENNNEECCGDDSGEFIICNDDNTDCICCDNKDTTYNNGKCGEIIISQSEESTQDQQNTNDQSKTNTDRDTEIISIPDNQNLEISNNIYAWNNFIFIPIILILISVIGILIFKKKEKPIEKLPDTKEKENIDDLNNNGD